MIPYSRQNIDTDDESAVLRVLRADLLTGGPEVELFEAELRAYIGCADVVVVNSGTAALHLALLAHGVMPGERVTVPALTFVATANAVLHAGAIPDFCDVDPETLLMRVADTGLRTTVILPVSLFGQACWDGAEFVWPPVLIEDAAHALGALRLDGRMVGFSWCAIFSFHPVKLITTGEGGAIAFDDLILAERARHLRSHGRDETGMIALGYNYRMPDILAALGRSQLVRMRREGWIDQRRALAYNYAVGLERVVNRGFLTLPRISFARSAWHLFPVLLATSELREQVRERMRSAGFAATVHYPVVPLQPYYRKRFGHRAGAWPVAEDAASRLLSLPFWQGMPDGTVERVCEVLEGF